MATVLSKEFLDIQTLIECRFTLKLELKMRNEKFLDSEI